MTDIDGPLPKRVKRARSVAAEATKVNQGKPGRSRSVPKTATTQKNISTNRSNKTANNKTVKKEPKKRKPKIEVININPKARNPLYVFFVVITCCAALLFIASSTLGLIETEYLGTLIAQDQISIEEPRLAGPYINGMLALMGLTMALYVLFVLLFIVTMVTRAFPPHGEETARLSVLFVALTIGMVACSMNYYMNYNYTTLVNTGKIKTDPLIVVIGQNFKVRGVYGWSMVGMHGGSLLFNTIGFLWLFVQVCRAAI